jgi:hypothetical protein
MPTAAIDHSKTAEKFWELIYQFLKKRGEKYRDAWDTLDELQPKFLSQRMELTKLRDKIYDHFLVHLEAYLPQCLARESDNPQYAKLSQLASSADRERGWRILEALLILPDYDHIFTEAFSQALDDIDDKRFKNVTTVLRSARSKEPGNVAAYDPAKVALTDNERERVVEILKTVSKLNHGTEGWPAPDLLNERLNVLRLLYMEKWPNEKGGDSRETARNEILQVLAGLKVLVQSHFKDQSWHQALFGCEWPADLAAPPILVIVNENSREATQRYRESLAMAAICFSLSNRKQAPIAKIMMQLDDLLAAVLSKSSRDSIKRELEFHSHKARTLSAYGKDGTLRKSSQTAPQLKRILDDLDTLAWQFDREGDAALSDGEVARRVLSQLLQPLDDWRAAERANQCADSNGREPIKTFREGLLGIVEQGGYEELGTEVLSRLPLTVCVSRGLVEYAGDLRELANRRIEEVIQPGYRLKNDNLIIKPAKVKIK